ncbi:MAG: AbrB/MazE/SpoVT family DNA-binding domain-containing protein [Candidatus Helarchaeota archaeon]|nr:AbrB/MazE/SpoVT family DNA-binding domain-containing protein [Candidatus Helarchaeota archaeon]
MSGPRNTQKSVQTLRSYAVARVWTIIGMFWRALSSIDKKTSTANQITLPKEVRDVLKIESGNVVGFYQEPDGKITLDR